MKKVLAVLMTLTLALAILPAAALSDAGDPIWQIGTSDGAVNPIDGADEYPATGAFHATFDYYVGTDPDPINEPTMPGYIGNVNVCYFDPGRPCTDTTEKLNIHFTLAQGFENVKLYYDRYGSEENTLYLNGVQFDQIVGPGEGQFAEYTFELGLLPFGDHTITIEYAGGGAADGHYIDYLKLTGDPCFSLEWLPPISLDDWTLNENATLPIKFQLVDCDGEVITEQLDPTLSVYFDDGNGSETLELRFDEGDSHYIGLFRPDQSGTHTAVVSLDDVEIESLDFEVVEPGRANGRGRGHDK